MPKVQVKQPAGPFIHIDNAVNPLMTDGLFRLFQLQALCGLLGTKTLLPPERNMRMQPYFRLSELVCAALAKVAKTAL
jgi:hypothetical protein